MGRLGLRLFAAMTHRDHLRQTKADAFDHPPRIPDPSRIAAIGGSDLVMMEAPAVLAAVMPGDPDPRLGPGRRAQRHSSASVVRMDLAQRSRRGGLSDLVE